MKNKLSHRTLGGNARIIELYKNDNWNIAKAGVAGSGMTAGGVCVVHKANGQSVIFTCRAATPEPVSDEALQAIRDNCAMRIVLKEGHAHD